MTAKPFRILRPGALGEDEIASALRENLCLIGITGGSGCGKTTALNALSSMGALVIDCDEVYHEMLKSDEEMLLQIKESFGDAFDENGVLDRKKLGNIVFSDALSLKKLNEITHTHIKRKINELLNAFAMQGGKIAGIDAIELISSDLAGMCRSNIAICADREKRIERIMQRDSITREYAEARIGAQRSDDYFKEHCDYVIYNNGSAAELENKFLDIIKGVI